MTNKLTVTNHKVERDVWERCSTYCPKCGSQEVWRESHDDRDKEVFAAVSQMLALVGACHVCTHCKQVFKLSLQHAGEGVRRMLKQHKASVSIEDEESSKLFYEMVKKLGVQPKE